MGENPMLSDPDSCHVEEALKKIDFLVVQDIFISETAELADIILPGCSFAEKDGTFTNTERKVQLLRQAIKPIGNCREDWKIICELAKKILAVGRTYTNRARITVNLATFIPKPHTPLQRERQISIEETIEKQKFIKQNLKARGIEVRWHQAEASFLEGVFARGDKPLSKVIEKAWELGARLDAWSEHFKFDVWKKAFTECGIKPDDYLRERQSDASFPWSFINATNKD